MSYLAEAGADKRQQARESLTRHTAALLVFSLAYSAGYLLKFSVFAYLPLECRWALRPPPGAVAIPYYGLIAQSLAAWVLGYLAASLPAVSAFLARPMVRPGLGALAAIAVLGSLLIVLASELHWLPGH